MVVVEEEEEEEEETCEDGKGGEQAVDYGRVTSRNGHHETPHSHTQGQRWRSCQTDYLGDPLWLGVPPSVAWNAEEEEDQRKDQRRGGRRRWMRRRR